MSLFVTNEPTPLIMFSLRPRWHRDFAEGTKAFEYRRRFLSAPFSAVVYVSGTAGAVAAFARFDAPRVGTADEIAELAATSDGVDAKALTQYFQGSRALALPVIDYRLMPPVTLHQIREVVPGFHPPQSYTYVLRNRPLFAFLNGLPEWSAVLAPWVS